MTTAAAPASSYFLRRDVFLCLSGTQVVLLDVRNDRYLALDAMGARALASLVPGWPVPDAPASEVSSAAPDPAETARLMLQRELLTSNRDAGKEAMPLVVATPTASLMDDDARIQDTGRFSHAWTFLDSALRAAIKLRSRSIERIVRDVRARREAQPRIQRSIDLQEARELVNIFNLYRPFAFTAHNACLFDSLALVDFLGRYGLYPHWVFGVQTAPFNAHCWVQEEAMLFNDTLDHVSLYTPIMEV